MENKLPKVFANAINKKLSNNTSVFYSGNGSKNSKSERIENTTSSVKGQTVIQKINSIFKSKNFVYKATVIIRLKTGEVKKDIIGKNTTYLITIDNEKIPIVDIVDIDYAN